MPWQVIALIGIITVSIALILQRSLMKEDKSDPIAYAIIFQFLLGLIALVPTLILGKWTYPPIKEHFWQFALATVLWAAYTTTTFKAAKTIGAAEINILYSLSTVCAIILGVVLLHEHITTGIIFGAILILAGVILVTSEKLSFKSKTGVFLEY